MDDEAIRDCFQALWTKVKDELWNEFWTVYEPVHRDQPEVLEAVKCRRGSVQYQKRQLAGTDGRYFSAQNTRGVAPKIEIHRAAVPDQQYEPDLSSSPRLDLIILAHEYGHHLSEKQGNYSAEYLQARDCNNAREDAVLHDETGPTLTVAQARLVWDEEVRAWKNAYRPLRDVMFTDWPTFEETMRDKLGSYAHALGKFDSAISLDDALAAILR